MANELSTGLTGSTRVSMAEEREHSQTLMAKRITEIPTDQQMRVEYNSDGTHLYVGYGARGLASSDDAWLIHKFTYVSQQVTLRQSAYDVWDDRSSATYA